MQRRKWQQIVLPEEFPKQLPKWKHQNMKKLNIWKAPSLQPLPVYILDVLAPNFCHHRLIADLLLLLE